MHKPSPVGMMLDFAYGRRLADGQRTDGAACQPTDPVSFDRAAAASSLAAAARAWWQSRRPAAWTLEQHLHEPTAGCDGTPQERALAEAIAQGLRENG